MMAWAAQFQWIQGQKAPSKAAQFQWIQGQNAPSKSLEISRPATKMRIGEEVGCSETRARS